MRRFRQGATKGPGFIRPGAGYGRLCFGAPGPTQEVEPREQIVPELFTHDNCVPEKTTASDFKKIYNRNGDTIIDLTSE